MAGIIVSSKAPWTSTTKTDADVEALIGALLSCAALFDRNEGYGRGARSRPQLAEVLTLLAI